MTLEAETVFLARFEAALRQLGVAVERREVGDGKLMPGVVYMYKIGEGDRHCFYGVGQFMIEHPENLAMANALAEHAASKLRLTQKETAST